MICSTHKKSCENRACRLLALAAVLVGGWTGAAVAQSSGGGGAAPQPEMQQSGQAAAVAPSSQWEGLRPLVVERVFRGPLRDTVVQRLRDPVDGSTCFIYLPMSAAVAAQGQFLVYGPNAIGSISCFGPAHVIQLQQLPPAAPTPTPTRQR